MKSISIDTSGKFCSVSISISNTVKETIRSDQPFSHSSELAVNVKRILDKYSIFIQDLDFIAINIGPGSFTGLRIGVSFAKGLCLSNDVPLIPICPFNIINSKVNSNEEIFYYAIYSHKDYIYAKKYNKNKFNEPELLSLTNNLNHSIYLYGLDKVNQYDNNIISIDFNSSDLIKLGEKSFEEDDAPDLNLINPIYIDYTNG